MRMGGWGEDGGLGRGMRGSEEMGMMRVDFGVRGMGRGRVDGCEGRGIEGVQ